MVKRRSEMTIEVRERMREGRGTVEILHVFREEELRGKARLFARLRIPTGSAIGFHLRGQAAQVGRVLRNGSAPPVEINRLVAHGRCHA